MTCLTHLVECLKNKGVEPEARASSIYSSEREPSFALIYDTSKAYRSKDSNEPQWWTVDFRQLISIKGYTIGSFNPSTDTVNLYNFTLSVSFDNKTWKVAHGPLQRHEEETSYNLKKPVNAQFIRIDGNSLYSSHPQSIFFHYIKFYGSLNPVIEKCAVSCKTKKRMNLDLMRMIFVLCK